MPGVRFLHVVPVPQYGGRVPVALAISASCAICLKRLAGDSLLRVTATRQAWNRGGRVPQTRFQKRLVGVLMGTLPATIPELAPPMRRRYKPFREVVALEGSVRT
jgi:hypothetical protein